MFLAHISKDKLREQSILHHLSRTAELAGDFADDFGCKDWGYGCGLLHDIGKYSEEFQNRLRGGMKVDHATAGAKELFEKHYAMAAYCVAGHHSGIPDGGSQADSSGTSTLQGRMKKHLCNYQAFQQEIVIPTLGNPPLKPLGRGGFSVSFFIRMLFSCLVDGDYLDTEMFMSEGRAERGGYDSVEILYHRLMEKISSWMLNKDTATINGRRSEILRACLKKGREEQGLFQLTVPTGGGKTVSSLAFALEHARLHKLKRIIYVIPYHSIIEQNAKIFKELLGEQNVLEDHCNVVYEDGEELNYMQLAAENWDVPVVVTTNVQFFESLFANKTSKCRKLHNIAKSVVIFDEAQMLPVGYLKPCIQGISELIYNYHCTAVLCTATQPALQEYFSKNFNVREICPQREEQYQFFKRTTVKYLGGISEEELTGRLRESDQVLCILNSRKRVQRVYKEIQGEGVFHLSTLMYPAHRKRILELIRSRLKDGKVCKVVATSLVEAGVDLDFGCVMREEAGIDSIVQAAGRCNREGKREPSECDTLVFSMEKDPEIHMTADLKLPIAVAGQIISNYPDITALDAVWDYFRRLYHFKGEGLDVKQIVKQFEDSNFLSFPFASVAREFKIIENHTKTVLIGAEAEARAIAARFRWGESSRTLFRRAGQYCVSVYEKDFQALLGAGLLEDLHPDLRQNLFWLKDCGQYSEDMGLLLEAARGDGVFF